MAAKTATKHINTIEKFVTSMPELYWYLVVLRLKERPGGLRHTARETIAIDPNLSQGRVGKQTLTLNTQVLG